MIYKFEIPEKLQILWGLRVRMRDVILHAHFFKNAGSTIDWILHNNFKEKFVDHRDDASMLTDGYMENYIQRNDGLIALSSHQVKLPVLDIDNINLYTIVMFRHPVERVMSVYNFFRKQKNNYLPEICAAKKFDLNGYVQWCLRPEVGSVVNNFHTLRCLGYPKGVSGELTDDSLNKAKKFVDSCPLVGIVEDFDRSVLYFEKILGRVFPGFNGNYISVNTSYYLRKTFEERIEKVKGSMSVDVHKKFIEQNRYDIELYHYACNIFSNRFEKENILMRDLKVSKAKELKVWGGRLKKILFKYSGR